VIVSEGALGCGLQRGLSCRSEFDSMKQCSGGGIECWLQEKSLRGRGWCTPWIGTSSERWRMSDSSSRRTRAARGVARCSLRKATLRKGDGGALLRGALSRRSRRLWMTPRCATRREDCCCRHILGRLGRALTQRALGALGRRQAEAQEVKAGGRVGGWWVADAETDADADADADPSCVRLA